MDHRQKIKSLLFILGSFLLLLGIEYAETGVTVIDEESDSRPSPFPRDALSFAPLISPPPLLL